MITQISIENFKSWEASGPVRLAPLTIICGNNSSGKSSIPQFLLMLKQTVESYDRLRVLHLGDKDSLVDLGSWQDVVHRHEQARVFKFSMQFLPEEPLSFTDAVSNEKYGPFDLEEFDAAIAYDERTNQLQLRQFLYNLSTRSAHNSQNGTQPIDFKLLLESEDNSKNKYELKSERYTLKRSVGRNWKLPNPENFFGFPNEAVANFQNTGFLTDLSLSIKNLFKSIYYVGPLREHPERFYQFSGEIPPDVGPQGRLSVNAMLAAADRKISRGKNKKAEPFQALIARWLKQMGLIHEFHVAPIAKGRKEYEVRIRIQAGAPEVLITDVGFGISQVLPVMVQSFYVPANSTILLEQPEIHLHPSVQSHLADLLIEAIHARENGEPRNTQLIVESHSEHLIRRVQRRIAEEQLHHEDVAIYFVTQKKGVSKIEALQIDEYGNISNWPEHFFGDEFEDVTAMTLKAIERKKAAQYE
ncbi:MAG: DUF3696 domain-containing protein [Saprospiraceae bacterium]|nr:DUF3696 domain-containing protein [Saprospiraceae bacterium]